MAKEKTAPTIKDVANLAGVSVGTVSKVINGKSVGDSYEKKVKAAIKTLNYKVNSYAQGLKASKTYTAVVIIPNTYHSFFGSVAHYLNVSLTKRGYKMLMYCTEQNSDLEQEFVDLALQNKVDGIIGLTYNPDLKISDNVPFISIDRIISPTIPCVACDNYAGGQLAAEKLFELGCKKVLYLRMGSDLNNEPNKRKAGFENGCALKGLDYEIKMLSDEMGDSIYDFVPFIKEHIKNEKPDFDGIFCSTDSLLHVIKGEIEKMGLHVPEDIQMIGFDGVKEHGFLEYTCSTIVQPVEEMAEMCVELLVSENMKSKPPLVCLPVRFAEGGTTRSVAK